MTYSAFISALAVTTVSVIASAASAAEGDVQAYAFQCYVVSASGEKRVLSGAFRDVEAKHYMGGPYIKRNVAITDGSETLSSDVNVDMRRSDFEARFNLGPAKDSSDLIPFAPYHSYKFDWNGGASREVAVTLQQWVEPRPAVRTRQKQTAAGMCKFDIKGAEA